MEPLSWTGALGTILDPILYIVGPAFLVLLVLRALVAGVMAAPTMRTNPDGTLSAVSGGLPVLIPRLSNWVSLALGLLVVAYLLAGATVGAHGAGIIGGISQQLVPVWLSLIALFIASFTFKRRLGLYGKLFDSTIGMVGFALVMFWVFTGIYSGLDMLITHDPLSQVSGMKNKGPGTPLRGAAPEDFQWYLLGGDNLARDVFSRVLSGSTIVIAIAPLATLFAFMVGITLGLPAGYYGGKLDTFLSFLANLILAFPVILLFYLLVTPEIVQTGLPQFMAVVLFFFRSSFLRS